MLQIISLLFRISRPRFWLYTAGPYLLGTLAVIHRPTNISWQSVALFVFFLFPANLLIYGVNDVYDYETDKHNPKKAGYERLMAPESRLLFAIYTGLVLAPFIFLLPLLRSNTLLSLAGFFFFSIFYSAPPIRAKARPVLDMSFNVLYVFPGIAAYWVAGGIHLSPPIIIAATFWCMAMHAFSAIPDIEADRAAHLSTVATLLGLNPTLVLCTILYSISGLLVFPTLGATALVLGGAYASLMALSWRAPANLFSIYRLFPYLNGLAGMLITLTLLLNR